ncbi:MAG: RHS repeat-associated core domain-containing protein, partial [Pyrinomonadaceae bacterium]
ATLASTVYGTASGGDNQRVEHFVQEFYYGALQREPTSSELQQQTQRLNNAAALGQSQVVAEAQAMGGEIFQATNYNSSHTTDQYVTDLYEAFLQRAPDGPGLNFWVNNTQANGRAASLAAFKGCTEYAELSGTLYREANWLVGDQLGTPRMIVNKSGSLASVKRHDYLPFGEELFAGAGGRTTAQGYVGDNVRQKFTLKERDNETGLDYFLARYYSSMQGRFTGIDPEQEGANANDPQSWNGYAYARSSPLVYSDPDGREYVVCDPNGKNCTTVSDKEFYAERKAFEKTGNTYTGSRDFYESGQVKNADGGVVATYVQISIDDPVGQFVFAMRRAVDPIPKATAQFFGISLVVGATGGAAVYALGPAPAVTTLGLATRAAPVAAGATGVLSQLSRTDASIFQKAAQYGASAGNSFMNNLHALTRATVEKIPGGQLDKIGQIGNSPVYGSGRSGVGIAEVKGVTVVVKMVRGTPQIIGPLP